MKNDRAILRESCGMMLAIMNRRCLVVAILAAASVRLYAKENPAAQQLLDSARKQESMFQEVNEPFRAEFALTAQLSVPAQGRLTLKWESKDHWWTKLVLASYEQITIRNGEWEYTIRNLPFTPRQIQDLFALLGLGTNPAALTAKEERSRKKKGGEILCVQGRPERIKSDLHNLCVDAATHELLSDDWQAGLNERRKAEFSGLVDFDGQKFPQKVDLLINGKRAMSADLETIAAAAFDPALLVPPKNAIARRKCPGMKPPQPINTIEVVPGGPGSVNQAFAVLTVLTDGSVGDVQIVGKSGPLVNEAVIAGLKKFRFRPAMCGQTPVVSDVQIVVP
jgi:hypothetical protein